MQAAQESAAEGVPAQEVRQGSVLAARQPRLGSLQCGVPGAPLDLRKRRRWRQVVATLPTGPVAVAGAGREGQASLTPSGGVGLGAGHRRAGRGHRIPGLRLAVRPLGSRRRRKSRGALVPSATGLALGGRGYDLQALRLARFCAVLPGVDCHDELRDGAGALADAGEVVRYPPAGLYLVLLMALSKRARRRSVRNSSSGGAAGIRQKRATMLGGRAWMRAAVMSCTEPGSACETHSGNPSGPSTARVPRISAA